MEPHPETLAPAVVPPVIAPVETYNGSVKNRIITPYRADRFESILRQLGLWTQYSDLPHRLRTGFLIGEFDPLTRTHTPPNHLHRPEQLKFVSEYVREQVQLRRMSGPYTQTQVESFLGGPFMSSPIFLIHKAGSPGKFRLIQDCSFKNKDGFSVNDFIDSDKFPTRWNTALEVAQIVSFVHFWRPLLLCNSSLLALAVHRGWENDERRLPASVLCYYLMIILPLDDFP